MTFGLTYMLLSYEVQTIKICYDEMVVHQAARFGLGQS
jgi:hypothetical protein